MPRRLILPLLILLLNLNLINMGAIALAIAGTAAAGATLAGAANLGSTAMANKQNAELMQMQNDFNAAEAEKQRDFAVQQWQRENEYNTPSAQRQRLVNAGYSPYLLGSNMSAVGGSAGSTQAAQASQLPTMQQMDFSSIGSAISEGIGLYNDIKRTESLTRRENAQATQINIENQFKASEMMANIHKATAEAKDKLSAHSLKEIERGYLGTIRQNQINMQNEEINNAIAIRGEILSRTALTNETIKYYGQEKAALISKFAAETFAAYKKGLYDEKAARNLLSQRLKTEAETGLLKQQYTKESYNQKNYAKMADELMKSLEKANKVLDSQASYNYAMPTAVGMSSFGGLWLRKKELEQKMRKPEPVKGFNR